MDSRTDTGGALEFLRFEIHRRVTILDASDTRDDAGFEKHDFRQGCFSGTAMGHEGDISNLIRIYSHLRSSLTRSKSVIPNFYAPLRGLDRRVVALMANSERFRVAMPDAVPTVAAAINPPCGLRRACRSEFKYR